MARIAFLGLGNMGLPMAANLIKAGHAVQGFDLEAVAVGRLAEAGGSAAASAAAAVDGVECVVTMLPEGRHVDAAYLGEAGLLATVAAGTLLVDCSTIDVATSRAVHQAATGRDFDMVDAPVSGGVHGAEAATLTFMVGGSETAFGRAAPYLSCMGKAVVHAGPAGTGQAAKICNNMLLGIQMIAVAEAFGLAQRLELDAARLFEIVAGSSGQCWSMTSYCPVPGLVPTAPSNRDFAPGFTTAMMLKDLKLAQAAAQAVGASTPLGAQAAQLFNLFTTMGYEGLDFSSIIGLITGKVK